MNHKLVNFSKIVKKYFSIDLTYTICYNFSVNFRNKFKDLIESKFKALNCPINCIADSDSDVGSAAGAGKDYVAAYPDDPHVNENWKNNRSCLLYFEKPSSGDGVQLILEEKDDKPGNWCFCVGHTRYDYFPLNIPNFQYKVRAIKDSTGKDWSLGEGKGESLQEFCEEFWAALKPALACAFSELLNCEEDSSAVEDIVDNIEEELWDNAPNKDTPAIFRNIRELLCTTPVKNKYEKRKAWEEGRSWEDASSDE